MKSFLRTHKMYFRLVNERFCWIRSFVRFCFFFLSLILLGHPFILCANYSCYTLFLSFGFYCEILCLSTEFCLAAKLQCATLSVKFRSYNFRLTVGQWIHLYFTYVKKTKNSFCKAISFLFHFDFICVCVMLSVLHFFFLLLSVQMLHRAFEYPPWNEWNAVVKLNAAHYLGL